VFDRLIEEFTVRGRLGVVVLAAVVPVLAGCTSTVAGTAVGQRVPPADPAMVRWVDNFCGVANYLVASGSLTVAPVDSADPAVVKQSFSGSLGRVVDVLNVALHDLDALTPAPVSSADTVVELITEPLGEARDKFTSAKAALDAANTLTVDVFSTLTKDITDATKVMGDAVSRLGVVSLPEELKRAVPQAANCAPR
jgi:hypothetical protein